MEAIHIKGKTVVLNALHSGNTQPHYSIFQPQETRAQFGKIEYRRAAILNLPVYTTNQLMHRLRWYSTEIIGLGFRNTKVLSEKITYFSYGTNSTVFYPSFYFIVFVITSKFMTLTCTVTVTVLLQSITVQTGKPYTLSHHSKFSTTLTSSGQ